MEKAIASSRMLMGVISVLGPAMLALGAIDIGVRIGEGIYHAYQRFLDVDDVLKKFQKDARDTAEIKLFDESGLQTQTLMLQGLNSELDQLKEKKQNFSGFGNFASSFLIGPGSPYFSPDDQKRLDKLTTDADRTMLSNIEVNHKKTLDQIDNDQRVALARLPEYARNGAEIPFDTRRAEEERNYTSRRDHAQATIYNRGLQLSSQKIISEDDGTEEESLSWQRSSSERQAKQIEQNRSTSQEILHLQQEADQAEANGIAKLEAQRIAADSAWVAASCTPHRVAHRVRGRLSRPERRVVARSPYVTPPAVTFRTSMFAIDVNGNLVASVRPGDHVQIDDTASWPYAGDYEVLEPMQIFPPTVESSSNDGSLSQSPSSSSGEISFALGQYNEGYMYDTSDDAEAGWPSVPGSDPGNDTTFTSVDLANGGNFVFFTGQLPSGLQFQLPATGYPTANMLAWAGPAGANINYHSMRVIQLCAVDANRNLTLIYADDDGNVWNGDVNYAALTWLSPDTTYMENGITWLELTLLGGETILFGEGVLEDGTTIELPTGYSWTDGSGNPKAFAIAFPHDTAPSGYNAQSVGAYVDAENVVHFDYDDSGSHVWAEPRNAAVLVFAWKNNMGTVTTQSLGDGTWMQITLTNGKIFSVGCNKNMANLSTLLVPSAAGDQSTLEIMAGWGTRHFHHLEIRCLAREARSRPTAGVYAASVAPWHFLYFLPEPQGQGSLRPTFSPVRR
jgi:hypothetical protein